MSSRTVISGPYAHEKASVRRSMTLVMLALAPATAFSFYLFAWPAIFLFLLIAAAVLAFEAASLAIAGKPVRIFLTDGSALLTGWLLAMSLPPSAPWWIGLAGAAIAIIVGKQIFGGLGQNIFNPAMVARVALLISFPLEMTSYVEPTPLFSNLAPHFGDSLAAFFGLGGHVDAVSGASILGHIKTELGRGASLSEALAGQSGLGALGLGQVTGSLGETSAALLALGGIFLIAMRVISWRIPVAMLATLAAMASLFNFLGPDHYPNAAIHLLSGASILGAFFIATDPVTSPVSPRGQLLFGMGCGALVFIIRTWAGYPEGMAFAILLMNAATPLIDRYVRPRIFGHGAKKSGAASK
ncbi:MAG: RnfABCDGE type electron transport complex subunit D [Rhodobiaceae bacterium]|nr:RnfABCDGE type electron transport complex subunit D [Rhodobiaceae bacterium]